MIVPDRRPDSIVSGSRPWPPMARCCCCGTEIVWSHYKSGPGGLYCRICPLTLEALESLDDARPLDPGPPQRC